MSTRQLLRIAAALVIALFLWGLIEILGGGPSAPEEVPVVGAIDHAAVASVEILRGGDTTRFVRAGDAWRVNGLAADPKAVTDLLSAVADTLEGELVAQSAASHARLGVDADSGRVVRLVGDDGTLAEVIVGKQGSVFGAVYVRLPASDAVYQVRNDLAVLARRTVADWRDKTIFSLPAIEMGAVSVTRDGRTYRLERNTGWTFAGGEPADSGEVGRLVDRLGTIVAQGGYFATPEKVDSLDLTRPDRRLVIQGLGGDTLLDLSMVKEDSRFWARHPGDSTVFQLYEWRVNELTPADSTLRMRGE